MSDGADTRPAPPFSGPGEMLCVRWGHSSGKRREQAQKFLRSVMLSPFWTETGERFLDRLRSGLISLLRQERRWRAQINNEGRNGYDAADLPGRAQATPLLATHRQLLRVEGNP